MLLVHLPLARFQASATSTTSTTTLVSPFFSFSSLSRSIIDNLQNLEPPVSKIFGFAIFDIELRSHFLSMALGHLLYFEFLVIIPSLMVTTLGVCGWYRCSEQGVDSRDGGRMFHSTFGVSQS